MKENMLNSFHKRFLFKISPSVKASRGGHSYKDVVLSEVILDQFKLSSWMPLGTAGLPWAELLFFYEIQSASCSEGPKPAAMTATVLLSSSHHQNSGRKDWHELVFEIKIDKFKHRD